MTSSNAQQLFNVRRTLRNHFQISRTEFRELTAREKKGLYDRIKSKYPVTSLERIEELVNLAMK